MKGRLLSSLVWVAAASSFVAPASPVLAQGETIVRAHLATFDASDSDSRALGGIGTVTFDLDGGNGLGVSIERKLGYRFGIEVGSGYLLADVSARLESTGPPRVQTPDDTLAIVPITAALNVHLVTIDRWDVYAGPVAGFLLGGEVELPVTDPASGSPFTFDLAPKEDLLYGGQLGVDVLLGRELDWSLGARVTLLEGFAVEAVNALSRGQELEDSLLQVGLTVGRRW